ncbi:hypothetical protein [Kordiimonas sp.]|uniref:hypothetical protein n=1 Tax=Kordiimonas sp. TaxID=1970157 RepID=UPI003A957297
MNIGKFILNIVVAFVVYGLLYTVGPMFIMPEAFTAAEAAMKPMEETAVAVMTYHFVQTVVVVWLFGKAVGSGDIMAGVVFGFVIGLYAVATDSVWYTSLADFPQATRMPLMIMHLVINAVVGAVLAFMAGKGWGGNALVKADA